MSKNSYIYQTKIVYSVNIAPMCMSTGKMVKYLKWSSVPYFETNIAFIYIYIYHLVWKSFLNYLLKSSVCIILAYVKKIMLNTILVTELTINKQHINAKVNDHNTIIQFTIGQP